MCAVRSRSPRNAKASADKTNCVADTKKQQTQPREPQALPKGLASPPRGRRVPGDSDLVARVKRGRDRGGGRDGVGVGDRVGAGEGGEEEGKEQKHRADF